MKGLLTPCMLTLTLLVLPRWAVAGEQHPTAMTSISGAEASPPAAPETPTASPDPRGRKLQKQGTSADPFENGATTPAELNTADDAVGGGNASAAAPPPPAVPSKPEQTATPARTLSHPYEPATSSTDIDESDDSESNHYFRERVHIGAVIGMAKGFGLGGPSAEYGVQAGIRFFSFAEIGLLVAGSAQSEDLTFDAIPILIQLNGIQRMSSWADFYLGFQTGIVHYRYRYYEGTCITRYSPDGFTSWQDCTDTGAVASSNSFAGGLQSGISIRPFAHISLRFEVSWLYASSSGTDVDVVPGRGAAHYLQALTALCLVL